MEKIEEQKLELERKTRMRDNLLREQELFTKQIPELSERLRIHKEASDILRGNQKIILDNFKILKVTWAYEELPEYLDNLKKLNQLNFAKAELEWSNQVGNMSGALESANKQLEHSHEMLTKLNEEIATLEASINGIKSE